LNHFTVPVAILSSPKHVRLSFRTAIARIQNPISTMSLEDALTGAFKKARRQSNAATTIDIPGKSNGWSKINAWWQGGHTQKWL
jgi:hypothetical protein